MFSLVFLLAFIGLLVVATILVEVESFRWATLVLIGTIVGVQLLHVVDLLGWVKDHSVTTLIYFLVYVSIGVAWSFVKWFSFLIQFRDKFRELKNMFLEQNKLPANTVVPVALQVEFGQYLRANAGYVEFYGNSLTSRPKASRNKARIVSWMSFWPCSVIGTVLNDPVRRLFNYLFNAFKSLYQKLADHVLRNEVELK